MKKQIILLFIFSVYAISLSANCNKLNESILKYKQMQKDNYINKISQKRDSVMSKRDSRDLLRRYQELRFPRR